MFVKQKKNSLRFANSIATYFFLPCHKGSQVFDSCVAVVDLLCMYTIRTARTSAIFTPNYYMRKLTRLSFNYRLHRSCLSVSKISEGTWLIFAFLRPSSQFIGIFYRCTGEKKRDWNFQVHTKRCWLWLEPQKMSQFRVVNIPNLRSVSWWSMEC